MTSSLEKKKKACSNCGFENDSDAITCAQCEVRLNAITTVAAPAVAAIDELQPLTEPLALSVDEVLFMVAGLLDPVVVTLESDKRYLVIGRGVQDEELPNMDLTDASDTASSVSRRHALLDFHDARPTVTDLNSTNGTWVNETRLNPHQPSLFRNGDLLRFGRQFVFVYYSTGSTAADIVSLCQQDPQTVGLTPDALVVQVGGYLQTLAGIQEFLNQARQRNPIPVTINDMNVRQAPQLTKIRIVGASDAIRLILYVIGPWRDRHQNELRQSTQSINDDLSNELVQLTHSKLEALAPELDNVERDNYAKKMLPLLLTLAKHPLDLNSEQKW